MRSTDESILISFDSEQGETQLGWSLGHSQEKKCNSPDTSSVRNKMPGHPARHRLPVPTWDQLPPKYRSCASAVEGPLQGLPGRC